MFGDELRAVAVPGGAGRCALAGANSIFKIHNSKLPIGLQPAEHASSATNCGPPPPPGCGPLRLLIEAANSAFKIQDSKFMGSRSSLAVCSGSGRSLRRNAQADAKADASSGPSRGEAAARCGFIRNRKFNIQNSRFKINWMPSTLGCLCQFGLQPAEGSHEADLRDASCGPPLPGGCGPPIAARLIRCKKPATGRRTSAAPGCSPPTSCEVDFACVPLGPGGPASRTARRLLKRPATTRPTTRKSPRPPKALARQKPLPAKNETRAAPANREPLFSCIGSQPTPPSGSRAS